MDADDSLERMKRIWRALSAVEAVTVPPDADELRARPAISASAPRSRIADDMQAIEAQRRKLFPNSIV